MRAGQASWRKPVGVGLRFGVENREVADSTISRQSDDSRVSRFHRTKSSTGQCGTISRMNIRRGMNRLFIIAWVVYGVWLLWFVIREPINTADSAALHGLQSCYHTSPGADWNQCTDTYRQSVKDAEEAQYREMREPSWIGLVLLALVVPPLVVYGIVLFLIKVASWVVAGFRTSTSQGPKARPS